MSFEKCIRVRGFYQILVSGGGGGAIIISFGKIVIDRFAVKCYFPAKKGVFAMHDYFRKNKRRKFGSQTSDNMDRWKSRGGNSQRREEKQREDQARERVRRTNMQVREKVGKSRNTAFFTRVCGSGGLKSRLAKAAGAEQSGQMSDAKLPRRCGAKHMSKSKCTKHTVRTTFGRVEMSKKCTLLWREAHFEVKMHKAHSSDHFWKLRCRKSARRCGAKHISKSKVLKTDGLGALLGVEMLKKCTLLWREAHFEVKMHKAHSSDHFWKLRCRKSARRCGAKHISKSKVLKTDGLGALLGVEMLKKCTPLWREAHFQVKMLKTPGARILHLAKSEQNVRLL